MTGKVYTYGAKLEVASPRFSQRADFFVYICFACLVILVSYVHLATTILFLFCWLKFIYVALSSN